MTKKILLLFYTVFFTNTLTNAQTSDFYLNEVTIRELQTAYKSGKYTIEQVTKAYLERIEAIDKNGPALNSIIQVNPDAIKIAKKLDKEYKSKNNKGPLYGIPVILKDNIDTHDKMMTTAGSRALLGSYPLEDSYIVTKLREAGAVIIAKANLSEWANFRGQKSISGWSGVNGQTKNPYILDCNPCGSSAGSGVSVSANLAVIAIGTETNGSIVCPSHANGVVGIKPTVGLLSRSGIIPISFTQDTPGPMARSVEDATLALGLMVGIDSKDSKTQESKGNYLTDYSKFLNSDGLKGKRIGLYKPPLGKVKEVDSLMNITLNVFKSAGAEIIELDEFIPKEVGAASFNIMLFEYKDGLNKYFNSLGKNGKVKNIEELIKFNKNDELELKYFNQLYLEQALEKGDLNSEEYKNSLETMLKGSRENGIDKVMNEYKLDAIIAPTGSPAWKTDYKNGDKFHIGSSSPAARAGYPNITVPMGFVDELPVGLSIFGKAWSEPVLIEIAYSFEQKTKARKSPKFIVTK